MFARFEKRGDKNEEITDDVQTQSIEIPAVHETSDVKLQAMDMRIADENALLDKVKELVAMEIAKLGLKVNDANMPEKTNDGGDDKDETRPPTQSSDAFILPNYPQGRRQSSKVGAATI